MHPMTRVYARYIDKLDIKKSQPKNPKYKYMCRWFRFAQLAKGKKFRP